MLSDWATLLSYLWNPWGEFQTGHSLNRSVPSFHRKDENITDRGHERPSSLPSSAPCKSFHATPDVPQLFRAALQSSWKKGKLQRPSSYFLLKNELRIRRCWFWVLILIHPKCCNKASYTREFNQRTFESPHAKFIFSQPIKYACVVYNRQWIFYLI